MKKERDILLTDKVAVIHGCYRGRGIGRRPGVHSPGRTGRLREIVVAEYLDCFITAVPPEKSVTSDRPIRRPSSWTTQHTAEHLSYYPESTTLIGAGRWHTKVPINPRMRLPAGPV